MSLSLEMKVPKNIVDESSDWTTTEEMHPFWLVNRGSGLEKTNMTLEYLNVQKICACDPQALDVMGSSAKSTTEFAHIQFPCLVNNVDVEADTELILKWSHEAVTKTEKEKRKNADDQLVADARSKKARQT